MVITFSQPLIFLLEDHNVRFNKRFLRFGRNFGEPFLRFGRGGTSGLEDAIDKRFDSYEDKAYLRFGRSDPGEDMLKSILLRGAPSNNGLQYRRKRDTVDETTVNDNAHSRQRRSVQEPSVASADAMKRSEDATVDFQVPRLRPLADYEALRERVNDLEKRFMRFGRNGWLHFGKRGLEL
ncbi:FMRFamide neuropeptides-like [Haliotis asinina]|uniref:FMRFamide neuropeptides-like n=1 Tax=Haliotis asinina TaxID=109174 RepID=UPI003531A4CD